MDRGPLTLVKLRLTLVKLIADGVVRGGRCECLKSNFVPELMHYMIWDDRDKIPGWTGGPVKKKDPTEILGHVLEIKELSQHIPAIHHNVKHIQRFGVKRQADPNQKQLQLFPPPTPETKSAGGDPEERVNNAIMLLREKASIRSIRKITGLRHETIEGTEAYKKFNKSRREMASGRRPRIQTLTEQTAEDYAARQAREAEDAD